LGRRETEGGDVTIWHGKKDVNTPFSAAEKAAKLIKGCEFKGFEEDTHLSLPYNKLEDLVKNILKIQHLLEGPRGLTRCSQI
jgi:hypothetical protein